MYGEVTGQMPEAMLRRFEGGERRRLSGHALAKGRSRQGARAVVEVVAALVVVAGYSSRRGCPVRPRARAGV